METMIKIGWTPLDKLTVVAFLALLVLTPMLGVAVAAGLTVGALLIGWFTAVVIVRTERAETAADNKRSGKAWRR